MAQLDDGNFTSWHFNILLDNTWSNKNLRLKQISGYQALYISPCQWDPDPPHNLRNDFLRRWIHRGNLSTLWQIVGAHVHILFQDIWHFALPEKGEDQVTNIDDPFFNTWHRGCYCCFFELQIACLISAFPCPSSEMLYLCPSTVQY